MFCRNGETVPQALLTQIVALLSALSPACHSIVFSTPFISSSAAYYQLEASRLLQTGDGTAIESEAASSMEVPTYLNHVLTRMQEEGARSDTVLGKDVKGPVIRVLEQTLVGAHTATLIERGLYSMLDKGSAEDLRHMYSLCGRVEALKALREAFHNYVKVSKHTTVSVAS